MSTKPPILTDPFSRATTLAPVSPWKTVHWLLLFLLALAGRQLLAQSNPVYPTWWANYGVLSANTPNDYSAANQGQAKNIAVAAVSELNNDLSQFGEARRHTRCARPHTDRHHFGNG